MTKLFSSSKKRWSFFCEWQKKVQVVWRSRLCWLLSFFFWQRLTHRNQAKNFPFAGLTLQIHTHPPPGRWKNVFVNRVPTERKNHSPFSVNVTAKNLRILLPRWLMLHWMTVGRSTRRIGCTFPLYFHKCFCFRRRCEHENQFALKKIVLRWKKSAE